MAKYLPSQLEVREDPFSLSVLFIETPTRLVVGVTDQMDMQWSRGTIPSIRSPWTGTILSLSLLANPNSAPSTLEESALWC